MPWGAVSVPLLSVYYVDYEFAVSCPWRSWVVVVLGGLSMGLTLVVSGKASLAVFAAGGESLAAVSAHLVVEKGGGVVLVVIRESLEG